MTDSRMYGKAVRDDEVLSLFCISKYPPNAIDSRLGLARGTAHMRIVSWWYDDKQAHGRKHIGRL